MRGIIFVTREDEYGVINVVVWKTIVERQRRELLGSHLLYPFSLVYVTGCWDAFNHEAQG